MKLVDILAVELKRWPEFLGDAVGQAGDGTLHNEMEPEDVEISRTLESYTLCKNFISDIVTRAEWQAAVDALNADKCEHSYANNIGYPECGELNAPKVVEWDGDRLPPTGTVCEHFGTADHTNWIEVQVIGHGHVRFHDVAFFEYMSVTSGYTVSYSTANNFRPIRTAEQIAAEEREKGIQAIQDAYTYTVESCTHKILHSQAARLYDAGCRLQVAK